MLAAFEVPPYLARVSTTQEQREALRRYLTTGLEPLNHLDAAEIADKADTPGLRVAFTGTHAHDLTGHAASFAKLVQGSMDVNKALAVSGLMVDAAA
ncbi:MAG: hypothetical protein OXF41_06885 [bacterium]|nr:hypothetical protein [bacterium]